MKPVIAVVLLSALAYSQSFQRTLRGRVSDQSGATEPAAKVTITDDAAQISWSTVTNDQGEYAFNTVTPATYSVTAEAPGFRKN